LPKDNVSCLLWKPRSVLECQHWCSTTNRQNCRLIDFPVSAKHSKSRFFSAAPRWSDKDPQLRSAQKFLDLRSRKIR
jgi:hypothetical protein